MKTRSKFLSALCLVAACALVAHAADVRTTSRLFDREQLQTHVGTLTVYPAGQANTWTNFNEVLKITPDATHALYDVSVTFDLAKAATGFSATAGSGTIVFDEERAVDGTNQRVIQNLATTALSGTNAAGSGIRLTLGQINPSQVGGVQAKLSTTSGFSANSFIIPYTVSYRSGAAAVVSYSN